MNKTIKVISILLIAMMVMVIGSTNVMAAEDIIGQLEPTYSADGTGITAIGQNIINVIFFL